MTTTTTLRPCGPSALLVECSGLPEAVAVAAAVERLRPVALDVVAAARTVLVTVRDPAELPGLWRRVEDLLHGGAVAPTDGVHVVERDPVTIDVRYDGPDLADVAEMAGVSRQELVRTHTSITWRAAFGGFAPGFFYLVDDRELTSPAPAAGSDTAAGATLPTIPRLDSPRPRVPAGSVGVADRFCAVYPGASPGGWRLLGTTDAPLWDLDRPEPALLGPGMLVRFRDAGGAQGRDEL